MSLKIGRLVEKNRREHLYMLIFDLIKDVKTANTITPLDAEFLTETLKEILSRIEHHELGRDCPGTDIDFLETTWGQIVAITLKCRSEKPPTEYERKHALTLSKALSKYYGRAVPLFIEYIMIDEKTRSIGQTRKIEWANKGIFRDNISKETWQSFHSLIRSNITDNELTQFFNHKSENFGGR